MSSTLKENQLKGVTLPPINPNLDLTRMQDVAEYIKSKTDESPITKNDFISQLDELKKTFDNQHLLNKMRDLRENEVEELRVSLNKLTNTYLNEKSNYMKLQNENDRLTLKQIDNKRKIETLLRLTNLTENEVEYFHKVSRFPNLSNVKKDMIKEAKISENRNGLFNKNSIFTEMENLKAQIAEQRNLAKEHIEALKEDTRIRSLEFDKKKYVDKELISSLTDQLYKTQILLYESYKQLFEMKSRLNSIGQTSDVKKNKTKDADSKKATFNQSESITDQVEPASTSKSKYLKKKFFKSENNKSSITKNAGEKLQPTDDLKLEK